MVSDKVVFLVAVVGVVSSQPFSKESSLFNDASKLDQTVDVLNEPFQDTTSEFVTKSPPKFPKKYDPSRDSKDSNLSKGDVIPKTSPAVSLSSVDGLESQSIGLFGVPLYRQDFIPPSDPIKDSSSREVVIYSRYPYDVEGFEGIPENKDTRSYSKTLKFIMELLKQKALEAKFEEEAPEQPDENEPTDVDAHSIYTSGREASVPNLTKQRKGLPA